MQNRSKWILHTLFVLLILTGIAMKRLFDRPEWLPPFHIAALMVLVAVSVTRERANARDLDEDEEEA
jgi:hypothetical protein